MGPPTVPPLWLSMNLGFSSSAGRKYGRAFIASFPWNVNTEPWMLFVPLFICRLIADPPASP